MKFKQIIFITFFLLIGYGSFGQVYKYKSTSISMRVKKDINTEKENWGKWSEPVALEYFIYIDITNKQIRFDGTTRTQEYMYDIISDSIHTETDSNGDEYCWYECMRSDGRKFIMVGMLHSKNKQLQIYVNHGYIMEMYNVMPPSSP